MRMRLGTWLETATRCSASTSQQLLSGVVAVICRASWRILVGAIQKGQSAIATVDQ